MHLKSITVTGVNGVSIQAEFVNGTCVRFRVSGNAEAMAVIRLIESMTKTKLASSNPETEAYRVLIPGASWTPGQFRQHIEMVYVPRQELGLAEWCYRYEGEQPVIIHGSITKKRFTIREIAPEKPGDYDGVAAKLNDLGFIYSAETAATSDGGIYVILKPRVNTAAKFEGIMNLLAAMAMLYL